MMKYNITTKPQKVTYLEVRDFIEHEGYILLSNKYINARTTLKIVCPNNHRCDKTWDKFKNKNQRCSICNNNAKYTLGQVKDFIEQEGYVLLSSNYNGSRELIEIQCPNHHRYFTRLDSFKNKQTRCCLCNDLYKHENECREIFQQLTSYCFINCKPDFLTYNNIRLQLDGYCEELKLAFEYDGEQHYKSTSWGGIDALYKRQKYDHIKDQICKKYGIILIRIPYWEKHNKFNFIKNKLGERSDN